MRNYQLEHVGIAVSDPKAAAQWYQRVLGFEILHLVVENESSNAFLRDGGGSVVEFWQLRGVRSIVDDLTHHLQLHIALRSESPLEDAKYLMDQGATLVEIAPLAQNGDQTVALRDPWGNCIQLAKRGSASWMRR